MGEIEIRGMEEADIVRHVATAEKESRLRLQELRKKADSLDRVTKHIATERWKLAEDLIGEDDEDVRCNILGKLGTLKRVRKAMEEESE